MSRTVALTGATGFIGSALAHRFHTAGWAVRALVRASSPTANLATIPIQFVEGNLADLESLRRLVEGVDDVVHCAGCVRGWSFTDFESVNVHGVENIVRASFEQTRVPRFLLMSSLAAREPLMSPYAMSKSQGEAQLAVLAKEMEWTVLRPPAVYGPGDRELRPLLEWMGKGIALKLAPDQARFSLLYVDDLADAVVMCLENASSAPRVLELHDGYPSGYSWNDVIDTVERLCQRRVIRFSISELLLKVVALCNITVSRLTRHAPMFTPGKLRELRHHYWVCNNAAMHDVIGWTPKIALDEGLRKTFNWGCHTRSSSPSDTAAPHRPTL
ncbi:MAG TPA: NAD(P)-dependent oxidoreductase [Nitrospirales bacterium]|nr:NAD(P)-dependent oxidoreductase [Nitrospirales bacterium]